MIRFIKTAYPLNYTLSFSSPQPSSLIIFSLYLSTAATASTEELIQSYTASCQQWGVKPITKLLVQLQEIKDFSVRASSLTLKGKVLQLEVDERILRFKRYLSWDLKVSS